MQSPSNPAFLQPANSTTDMTVSCDRHRARATAFKCKSPKGPVRFACPCVIVTAVNLSRLFLKRHDHLRFMHHKGKKKNTHEREKQAQFFESENGRAAFVVSACLSSLVLACSESAAKLYRKRGQSYSWIREGSSVG